MRKLEKQALGPVVNLAHPDEVKQIRQNLVTWFSVFSFDFDTVRRLPDPPQDPGSIFPGMILDHTGDRVCVVDHWGCFNNYPLLYVAPVVRELDDPCPLDIDISADFRDLFSNNYFVRADDLFLAPRESLAAVSHGAVPMLRYGLLRRITRTMVLKFGQIGLLL